MTGQSCLGESFPLCDWVQRNLQDRGDPGYMGMWVSVF